ncbi:GNAT family N-acetyltransferase [Erythrobacter insulae]|uniref:GNAT family N-acetyltransferase n=1 Tax=Erythrobacter insulae TaxID=2584124 RepID=A0A547P703_9SPHN|nr:GNAT family N-acetyltransferase [Erythrobacter insulae]TRD09919.1 GNAT family N-acetyltransferase [Erythrobacter insulae]
MAYIIRPFLRQDADELANLTVAAIQSVGVKSYTAAQVAAWAARHPGPQRFLDRAAGGDHIIVAADASDYPIAYTLIEPDGHVDMLYCHPDHTRKGVADELLAAAEQYARSVKAETLFTEASELARPAFERAGYTVIKRRDFDIPYKGKAIGIHNYAMEKPIIQKA